MAKGKLKEALNEHDDPEMAVRISYSTKKSDMIRLILDKSNMEDQIVEDKEGKKLLLIGPEIAPALDELVMDYQMTPEGSGFIFSKLPES
jgi:Fe-S cluster assembly iron-binding protein IscA